MGLNDWLRIRPTGRLGVPNALPLVLKWRQWNSSQIPEFCLFVCHWHFMICRTLLTLGHACVAFKVCSLDNMKIWVNT
jgi:hypothetical protein